MTEKLSLQNTQNEENKPIEVDDRRNEDFGTGWGDEAGLQDYYRQRALEVANQDVDPMQLSQDERDKYIGALRDIDSSAATNYANEMRTADLGSRIALIESRLVDKDGKKLSISGKMFNDLANYNSIAKQEGLTDVASNIENIITGHFDVNKSFDELAEYSRAAKANGLEDVSVKIDDIITSRLNDLVEAGKLDDDRAMRIYDMLVQKSQVSENSAENAVSEKYKQVVIDNNEVNAAKSEFEKSQDDVDAVNIALAEVNGEFDDDANVDASTEVAAGDIRVDDIKAIDVDGDFYGDDEEPAVGTGADAEKKEEKKKFRNTRLGRAALGALGLFQKKNK